MKDISLHDDDECIFFLGCEKTLKMNMVQWDGPPRGGGDSDEACEGRGGVKRRE